MEWWIYLIIAIVVVVILIITGDTARLKAWLIVAVEEAEKALGGGTGPAKLKQVHDKFVEKFPIIAKILPYETFCKLVDKALVKVGLMLKESK